jgi:hypothetical protein
LEKLQKKLMKTIWAWLKTFARPTTDPQKLPKIFVLTMPTWPDP